MRRIQTWECKLSILMAMILSFIVPANIIQNGTLIKYNFGFPCEYWSIYQGNRGSSHLLSNLFDGNKGMNINILGFFANVFIIYVLLVLIKKIYMKVNVK
ncbi:MAG: hypothetical protein F8N39_00825 [Clostridiaceae bacterium]|nr:hypothetical protein [Clostridiaceae bacterium]